MNSIILLIAQKENRHLLTQLLSEGYQILSPEQGMNSYFDLCIIDGLTLRQCSEKIRARVAAEHPVFLPVLLLTNQHSVKRITAGLWKLVDDIILLPVEKRELLARVATLLRSRQLSLELKQVKHELICSQEEIKELKDELEQLNRLFQE